MSAKCLDDVREVSRTSSCGLSGVRTIPSTRDYPGTGDPADHPLETGLLPCKTGFFTSWRTLMRLALARDVGIGKCVTPRSLEVAAERHPVPAPRLRVAPHAERGKSLREDTCRCPYSVSWRGATRRVVDTRPEISFLARAVRTRARATPGGARPAREGYGGCAPAAKRQAGVLDAGVPSPCPRRPGRKPGPAYGPRPWRPVARPRR